MYSHVNNSVYYHLFDSVVNTYLIERCGLSPPSSPLIGLVVSSFGQVSDCFFSSGMRQLTIGSVFCTALIPTSSRLGPQSEQIGHKLRNI